MRGFIAVVATLWAFGVAGAAQAAPVLPPGFVDEPASTAIIEAPTAIAFTPGGLMLATEQVGEVHVQPVDGSAPSKVALNLGSRICSDIERGLLGLAIDPNFAANRYFYVYYTAKRVDCGTGGLVRPVNRVSRFTLRADNTADPASETILIDGIENRSGIHNAGDLNFGKDGHLYVTSGDGGCDYKAASNCAAANAAARDRNVLLGKVLRITRDGGIPGDNPYAGQTRCNRGAASAGAVCAEIFATGLRNPFRFAFDPNAAGTRFFVNDVGQAHWEEINEGKRAADYGWNQREGACAVGSYTNCPITPIGFTDPVHAYPHTDNCASVTGGAFVPNDAWPAPYAGSYLFADFVCGKIMRLVPRAGGGYDRVDFATNMNDMPVTHMRFGPVAGGGTALYYTSFFTRSVRRIRYVGSGNRPPAAQLGASATSGALPLQVTLDASGSSDPDGDALTFRYDFGDGSPVVTTSQKTVSHTYTTAGDFEASVVATDPSGAASPAAKVVIHAGNRKPTVEVVSPSPSHRFSVGEQLNLEVRATDPEDGVLTGGSLSWEVRRKHDAHFHPYGNSSGTTFSLVAPPPEDLAAVNTSWLEVRVTATDSSGASTLHIFDVRPKIVTVGFGATPVKVQMSVNGQLVWTPATFPSWPGYEITAIAPATRGLYRFQRWTDYVSGATRILRTGPQGDFITAYYKIT